MKYFIKQSFYLKGKYSGEAGSEIDKEHYDLFLAEKLQDHIEVTGLIPSFLKSDEEIQTEIEALFAEQEAREQIKKSLESNKAKAETKENELKNKKS